MYGLKQIAIDLLHGKLPKAAEQDLANRRLQICEACPEFTKISRQCQQCGCFMDIKVTMLDTECPLEKW